MFQRNPDEFLHRFITVDETWIHYFTPEKEQLKQWTSPDKPVPKKAKTVKSARKATVFWNTWYNSYRLPSVETNTINGDYYAALLDRFNNILKKKYPHLAKKKVLFYQDNARVYTCSAPMAKFNEFRYELLPHPAYLPDLASCDYFLFPNLKNSEERDSPSESISSPKQRLILKSWTNHIIRTA